jgi:galactokinase
MAEANPIASIFAENFRQQPDLVFFAPGLINLMGEHTDYNQGLQVLTTINRGVWAAASIRGDSDFQVVCNCFPEEARSWEVCALIAQDNEFDWSNILRSLTEQLFSRYSLPSGLNLYLYCQVPSSAGFSFVYSLVYASAAALLHCNKVEFVPQELAHLCWEVKRRYARLDPTDAKPWVLATAKPGLAYLHDAQTQQLSSILINPQWRIFVIDLAEPKQFLDSAIAQRTIQCQTAAKALGVNHLREVSLSQLEREQENLEAIIYRRARHVITENRRCVQMVELLAGTDMRLLAECFALSQASLQHDYDVTTERLDQWVNALKNALGEKIAVRLNGGGFGGSLVLIINQVDVELLQGQISTVLPEATLLPVQAAEAHLHRLTTSP